MKNYINKEDYSIYSSVLILRILSGLEDFFEG